jgi:hypothetical protein
MLLQEFNKVSKPWSVDRSTILDELDTTQEAGLTAAEAERRLSIAGYNRIESGKKVSPLMILVNQFISPFVLLLAIAAGLSFLFQEWLHHRRDRDQCRHRIFDGVSGRTLNGSLKKTNHRTGPRAARWDTWCNIFRGAGTG